MNHPNIFISFWIIGSLLNICSMINESLPLSLFGCAIMISGAIIASCSE